MDDFLVEMIARVEQQYSDIERECLILRKLLRPWPKKKQVSQELSSQVVKQTDDHVKEKSDGLTPSEKQTLEEMDRILNKAQRAIKIKEKVAAVTNADSNVNNQADIGKTIQKAKGIEEEGTACKKSETIDNGRIDKRNKGKVVTQKREVLGVKKNPPQTGTKDVKSSQQVSSSRLSSSKSVTPRPSSVTNNGSRPSSSRSRYTPAHVNAPFKTDMNTRVALRKNNHMYKNHLNKAQQKKNTTTQAQKQSSHLNGLKTLPKISSTVRESDSDCINPDFDDNETKIVSDNNCNSNTQAVSSSECSELFGQDAENPKEGDESRLEEIVPDHHVNKVPDNSEQSSLKQEESFSLKDKSSKIKVPQRFHKLVSENHTLLEKCSTAKLVKKMPNSDAAHNFIERLNQSSEVSQELWAKTKAMTCLQSHNLMLKSLKSLGIEAMSETSSFDTVYRAKRLLEFILSKFAQTQEEADYFSKVQFRPSPQLAGMSTPSVIDKGVRESLFKNQAPDTQIVKLRNDYFVVDALMNSKTWARLQFEKDLYQLQLQILSLSESDWWEFLTQDPENGGTVQMIHSLLTSSGEFFPAIVGNPYS